MTTAEFVLPLKMQLVIFPSETSLRYTDLHKTICNWLTWSSEMSVKLRKTGELHTILLWGGVEAPRRAKWVMFENGTG